MADIQVQLRRGTTSAHTTFAGAEGEVTVDTDLDTLMVHTGGGAGTGVRLAKHSELSGAGAGGTVTEVDAGTGLETSPASGITTTGTIGIAAGGVGATQLATGAVTSAKLANDAVTSAKISSTDTVFNVNDTQSNIGIGKLADATGAFHIEVDSGSKFPMRIVNNTSAGGTGLIIQNTASNATGGSIQLGAPNSTATATNTVNLDVSTVNNFATISHNGGDSCAFRFGNSSGGANSGAFFPSNNGSQDLGLTGFRWDDVWSNGTFNGSDRNIKQDIQDLDEAEKRVAVKCKGLIKKYRMKDAVAKKGNNARIHVGIIAQELQAAFESEGLDAFRYSMIGKDTWYEGKDKDGQKLVKDSPSAGFVQVTQMSVRYNELLAFIISAM